MSFLVFFKYCEKVSKTQLYSFKEKKKSEIRRSVVCVSARGANGCLVFFNGGANLRCIKNVITFLHHPLGLSPFKADYFNLC